MTNIDDVFLSIMEDVFIVWRSHDVKITYESHKGFLIEIVGTKQNLLTKITHNDIVVAEEVLNVACQVIYFLNL